MDLILFGPPGAGKGTQAQRLAAQAGVPQISTGDLMRAERMAGSDLGAEFDAYMSKGELVPDTLVFELLERRLDRTDARVGSVFDGYPRTLSQAERLDALLAARSRRIAHVVSIEVPLGVLVERITGRRSCQETGQIFHLRYNPPPSDFQGTLVHRKDDTEEVVRERYRQYQDKTAPLASYYSERGLLRVVDGVGGLDEVAKRVQEAIA